jgi:predicted nucleotidyltransferase
MEKIDKLLFPKNTLLATYRGSISHNTFIPSEEENSTDDVDLLGVFISPVDKYLGLCEYKETVESFVGKYDIVNYEFLKMARMLLAGNPNVISILYLNKKHYIYKNFYGRALIDNRDLFVSKHIYRRFTRYAENELKNMAKTEYQGYMGDKRKKLVKKYGFDLRHGCHCLRLLTMGKEFVETGTLNVYREHDAQKFIDIKQGRWTLDQVKADAERLFKEAEEAYSKCKLPEEPQTEKVEKLVVEIMTDYIKQNT